MKQKIIFFLLLIYGLITLDMYSMTATFSPSNGSASNLLISITWDDTVACQGSTTTIMYNIERNGTVSSAAYPISLQGFVPITNGFSCATVIPPSPLGVASFSATASPFTPAINDCTSCINNLGVWSLANPLPAVSGGFDMYVTVTFTGCGAVSFSPCITYTDDATGQSYTQCVANIDFVVVPHAELDNVVVGPICQGAIFTGTLPPPICTAQQGYSCSNCIPCFACSGITGTTCTACSGYTGCPACTACLPCAGCVACSGYTGSCGTQPFNFTVNGGVGGTVTLVDQTGGIFAFTPDDTFYGTASFSYNVESDYSPIIFCPATTGGLYELTYVQSPIASNISLVGCAGTGGTGSLAPFVSGGSGSYVFSQVGIPSCGAVTVNPDGSYSFVSPTGAGTCTFIYAATDTIAPNCVGTGLATITVNALPVATSATITTCSGQSVGGTLAATGGASPYTFAIVTNPAAGTLTLDPNFATNGVFTYVPNAGFMGTDSFTFSVTDSNGCVSVPGTETITVYPLPIAGATAIYGCANTSLTGSLASLVTGGTGTLEFSAATNPSCGTVLLTSNGSFTFTPTTNFTGICCFNYTVTQGGCSATGPAQVCIDVESAPTATSSTFNVCPNSTVIGNLNDNVVSSIPPNTFSYSSVFGGVMNSFDPTTGAYSFTTTVAAPGTAGFSFQVSDVLPCSSATQTITINVHALPVAATGNLQGCSNTAINGNLNPLITGDAPFTFTGPITQAGGTTVLNINGIFSFTPNAGSTGGNFTYEVISSFGCTGSGQEFIVVHPSPVAADGTNSGCAQTPLSGSLVPLVSGGTPPYVNYKLVGTPVNGSATVSSTGAYTFTPAAGVTSGSFVYEVTDSNGCTDTATITITVNPGPTANTGTFTGCGGGVAGSLLSLVSGNAPFTFTAPVGPVLNGTVTLTNVNNGSFIFIPAFPAPSQGSFNYQVTDSSVPPCTSKATPVYINIIEGPRANPASFTGCENQSVSGSLTPFVTGGMPGYSFSFTGTLPACASGITITPEGEVIFVPALNFTGPCVFDYCVTDSIACTDCNTVTVNVQQSPLATSSGPFNACVNNPFMGNLNTYMASGTPPFSFTGGNAINGTLMLQVTGPFAFTPAAIGFASFDYSAFDSNGCHSNTGTISVVAQESPTITGTSPLSSCSGTSVAGTATAASSVGLMPLVFSIAPGSEVNGTATVTQTSPTTAAFTFTPNVTVFPTPTVIGMVTIRVTASNGCYADLPVTINIHQSPIAGSTGLGSCSPVLNGSLTGLVSGGVPPYTFAPYNGFSPTGCGSVVIDPSGTFVYTANGTGPCTFFYQVTESSTSACASIGAVTVTTSIPPVVTDLITCSCFNVPTSINLNTLTSGGVPPYTFAIVGTPVGGTVFLNPITGIATFKPTPGFSGVASFQFQAFDGFNPPCASNIGTVTIPVPCC